MSCARAVSASRSLRRLTRSCEEENSAEQARRTTPRSLRRKTRRKAAIVDQRKAGGPRISDDVGMDVRFVPNDASVALEVPGSSLSRLTRLDRMQGVLPRPPCRTLPRAGGSPRRRPVFSDDIDAHSGGAATTLMCPMCDVREPLRDSRSARSRRMVSSGIRSLLRRTPARGDPPRAAP